MSGQTNPCRNKRICYNLYRTGEGTHNKKHASAARFIRRGETPITKNIGVVDEKGNRYEATYPKRARGLVKNGRARFVDENTICLACPPNIDLEDNIMNSDIFNPESHGDAQFPPKPPAPPIPPIPPAFNQYIPPIPPAIKELSAGIAGQDIPPVLNMEYVLSRIDIILNDTKHIYKALDTISEMKPSESEYQGGQSDSGRAEAVAAAVQSRETTNQQMLKLLEKMYDDLKPKSTTNKERAFDMAERVMNNGEAFAEDKQVLLDVLDTIRHING